MKQQENNFNYTIISQIGIWDTIIKDLKLEYWIELVYKLKTLDPGIQASNTGYHSNYNLHRDPQFYPLVDLLNRTIPHITYTPNDIITNMWANISSHGDFNRPHNHLNYSSPEIPLSGILYLKTPPKCGNVVFINPLSLDLDVSFSPKESQLLIFPKLLSHYVEPNFSHEDRISIAFNF
jgi:hypothetical protein